jgi:hypothetical protein
MMNQADDAVNPVTKTIDCSKHLRWQGIVFCFKLALTNGERVTQGAEFDLSLKPPHYRCQFRSGHRSQATRGSVQDDVNYRQVSKTPPGREWPINAGIEDEMSALLRFKKPVSRCQTIPAVTT